VAGIRTGGVADLLRNLQRAAAAGSPAAGYHPTHDVFGPEAAVSHPPRVIQQLAQLGGEPLQLGGALAAARTRAEESCQNLFVDVFAPRHAGVFHLHGDQRTRGFGSHQQLEPSAPGRPGDRGQLVLQLL
jgi:hypothetical protein